MQTTPKTPIESANDAERRTWLLATGAAGGVAAVATAVPFIATFTPSERAKALGAAVTVDIGDIPPGGLKTVEWRGKPVWIQRRTPEMLASLTALGDFVVDLKWDFTSWVPLVSKMLPSDVCKITKKGQSLNCLYHICGQLNLGTFDWG